MNEYDLKNATFKYSLLGHYIETNLRNKGIVVKEYLCYPEPSEWVLDNGYILREDLMYENNEKIIKDELLKKEGE